MTNTVSDSDNAIRHVDVAIIGAGTAGHNAYHQVTKVTDNVIVINDGYWTTTCATVGCMPSKLLIAAAERAHHASHSEAFGIEGKPEINGKKVMQRVQAERNRFAGFLQSSVDNWRDDQKIHGHATFTSDGLITAAGQQIKADYIIVSTGSVPFTPDGWAQKLGDRLLNSDSVFEMTDLPESIAVVGAGAMGLEFGQALHRLGVKVTLFNRSERIGGIADDEINDSALECVLKGIDTELGSSVSDVAQVTEAGNKQAVLYFTDANGQEKTWQGEYVLLATGRRNTLDKMDIEAVGVKLDAKNRPLDVNPVTGQVGDSHIYIVGDANARTPLMHVASNEGYHSGQDIKNRIEQDKELAHTEKHSTSSKAAIEASGDCGAEMLCDDDINANISADKAVADQGKPYEGKPATPLAIVFTDPQIAFVGQSISELNASNTAYVTGQVRFNNQGRSRVMGVNCGLLNIYVSPSNKAILGACMVGPDAEYIAHILGTAITNALTVDDLLASAFYHPTILEGLRTALRSALSQVKKYQS